jgi:hypothetical protein
MLREDLSVRPARPRGAVALWAAFVSGIIVPTVAAAEGPNPIDFGRDVLPILSDNCFLCHGPDPGTRKADLRLDLKEGALREQDPIVVPGQSGESELVFRVTGEDPEERMPPPKSGRRLTAPQIETLKRWIDEGAPWGKHWAFETPRRPTPPSVRGQGWPRSPIDRFILSRLEAEGLGPRPEAEKAALIRRVTLDLTGLPPTPGEVEAFLSDGSPDAYEKVVDRLLASAHYGERMAMDWLDGARYADTNGFQNDFARSMWPWRDWVIDAFNRNQPFDRFVIDQVAGDLLPGATRDQRVATGFNRNNRTVTEGGSIEEEWRIENAVDRVETTTTVLLGLTMGCARCHDHKFDPVSQREFYQFLGFFNSLNEKGVYNETRGNVPPLVPVPSREDEERVRRFDADLASAREAVRVQEAALPEGQRHWEEERRQSQEISAEPLDWEARFELDGGLGLTGPEGPMGEGDYRGQGSPEWVDGPFGKALKLDGQNDSIVEARPPVDFERTGGFSYGGWVRPRGNGALLSRMDDAGGYRGFDLLIVNGKAEVHVVSVWPGDATKVISKEAIPSDSWSHVFVTYDGSSKAAGLRVHFDGRPVGLDVPNDKLSGTIVTDQPLRLGRRSTGSPLKGELSDVRLYRRPLTEAEVRAIADERVIQLARIPEEGRSSVQKDLLVRVFRDRFAPEFRKAQDELAKLGREKADYERGIPTVMVMEDRPTPRETFLLKRGRYDMPDADQKVEPGVPSCLPPLPSDAPRTRLGLARWLVSPENPLTPRVIANRFWQHHFGTGLVKTAENFGVQGEPPSHPDLLDWLASELVASGWDAKAMHRRLVTSATYRQSSKAPAPLLQRDPENRLLARGPRFRLPAEVVRDNALAIGGLLSHRVGGPSIKPYQPAGLWEELAGGAGEGPYVQDKGADLYRRSLYVYRKRTVPHPAMATFDAPSREVCQVKRARTNTPLQALELLNDVTYVEAARRLAQLMLTEGGPTPEARIAYAYRRAVARAPSGAELGVLMRGLGRYRETFGRDPESAAQLLKHGESPVPPGLDPAELAAYTAVAGILLNLDETITLE